jgi:superfamily II DNA/RNA helicase
MPLATVVTARPISTQTLRSSAPMPNASCRKKMFRFMKNPLPIRMKKREQSRNT